MNTISSATGANVMLTQASVVQRQPVANPNQPETAQTTKAVTKPDLEKAVSEANDFLQQVNPGLAFSIDDQTDQFVVKVVDQATKEVLRQFPSEEMLNIAKALDQMKGLLVQQKV